MLHVHIYVLERQNFTGESIAVESVPVASNEVVGNNVVSWISVIGMRHGSIPIISQKMASLQ